MIVPVGGAQAMARHLLQFGPKGADLPVTGLCDADEGPLVRRGLAASGLGSPHNRREMEELGFFVCVDDLEQELIRAADRVAIEALWSLKVISARSGRCRSSRPGGDVRSMRRCTDGCAPVPAAHSDMRVF